MSKKLIAVVASAALALTGLMGIAPASALPIVTSAGSGSNLLVTDGGSGSGSQSDPFVKAVPDAGTVTGTSVLTLTVSSTLLRKATTITATSGIKLLDAKGDATNKYTSASGTTSLSLTTNETGAVTFYAFPTTTTAGVITVTVDTDVTQVYLKGSAGAAYAIKSVTPPAVTPAPEGKGVFSAVLVDAFGNTVTTGELEVSVIGGGSGTSFTSSTGTSNRVHYSTTTLRHEGTLTAGDTAGQIAVSAQLAGSATAAQITAFGTPVRTYFTVITTASLSGQVTALTAQVAALTAQLAESRPIATSVTKKKYNTLARKWNAANPGARVALKK
jgi:hypothetical protein